MPGLRYVGGRRGGGERARASRSLLIASSAGLGERGIRDWTAIEAREANCTHMADDREI